MTGLLEEVRLAKRFPGPDEARELRRSARITQERLAEEVGVHRVTLAKWEAGKRHPRGWHLRRYVEILDAIRQELAS